MRRLRPEKGSPFSKAAKAREFEGSASDRLLHRLASLSQVGVLCLGVFGYFYTVVPVFQNQQLQEQNARLELEKGAREVELRSLRLQEEKLRADIARSKAEWAHERQRNANLEEAVGAAIARELMARRASVEAQEKLEQTARMIDSARWELVMIDFTTHYFWARLNKDRLPQSTPESSQPGAFIFAAAEAWPKPRQELLAAIDAAQSTSRQKDDIPASYYADLRKHVEDQGGSLSCPDPDLRGLHARYVSELNLLPAQVEDEVQKQLTVLKSEYEQKKQRIEITDEYRVRVRHTVRTGMAYKLDRKFREELALLEKACSDKAALLIGKIRAEKGGTR